MLLRLFKCSQSPAFYMSCVVMAVGLPCRFLSAARQAYLVLSDVDWRNGGGGDGDGGGDEA